VVRLIQPHAGTGIISVLFSFVCDESYDSPNDKLAKGSPPYEPKTYVVAGFFADEKTWTKVERRWRKANVRHNITRFHASHLNAKTYEYEGWSDTQKIRYRKQLLRILKDQKRKLHAVSCGLLADEYRNVINDQGRKNFGPPYLVCFKTCVTLIAKEMDEGFAPEHQFAVILDRNDMEAEAVKLFYELKDDPGFKYRSRLYGCVPANTDELTALEVADFIAYETFRLLHSKRYGAEKVRTVLRSTLDTNGFSGYYFGADTLKTLKQGLESATCPPNRAFVIMPSVKENIRYAQSQ
jgi:hypothetical protein